MNPYTIFHKAEALSVIAIDPMDYANTDRLFIGLTDDKAAKKYRTMYLVDLDRTTGDIVKAEAVEDCALRRFYGNIDEDGRTLLAEVIAGNRFAAMYLPYLNKVA